MFTQVAKVIHYVTDMNRARAFYTGVFGLKPKVDYGGWVELDTQGATLCLHDGVQGPNPQDAASARVNISMAVDDLGKAMDTLRERGVTLAREPHHIHDVYYVTTVLDPDGNPIDIAGPWRK
jgi:catechol 2,3-dioxygenase-like lactoylglutathione lyase family enzyme